MIPRPFPSSASASSSPNIPHLYSLFSSPKASFCINCLEVHLPPLRPIWFFFWTFVNTSIITLRYPAPYFSLSNKFSGFSGTDLMLVHLWTLYIKLGQGPSLVVHHFYPKEFRFVFYIWQFLYFLIQPVLYPYAYSDINTWASIHFVARYCLWFALISKLGDYDLTNLTWSSMTFFTLMRSFSPGWLCQI